MKRYLLAALMGFAGLMVSAQGPIRFDSKPFHQGTADWKMARFQDIRDGGEKLSDPAYNDASWMEAIVPGTVLNTLVYNKVYPEPYYGLNNRRGGAIPDLSEAGRDFYTAWFRTEFDLPESYRGKNIWLRLEGINYRSEVWVNGSLLATTGGMFKEERVNITDYSRPGQRNALAIKVLPVDVPGKPMLKPWGAPGEFHNGGDGAIGLNTTMLMSVGWDFTFMDGVRDRNTGIWKGVSIYTTGPIEMRWPVIRSTLDKPGFDRSREQVGVTLVNPSIEMAPVPVTVNTPASSSFQVSFSPHFPDLAAVSAASRERSSFPFAESFSGGSSIGISSVLVSPQTVHVYVLMPVEVVVASLVTFPESQVCM